MLGNHQTTGYIQFSIIFIVYIMATVIKNYCLKIVS